MIDLKKLDQLTKYKQPSDVESVLYLFWDKGISYNEFCELPLPYIFSIIKSAHYVRKQEEMQMKKASRKR